MTDGADETRNGGAAKAALPVSPPVPKTLKELAQEKAQLIIDVLTEVAEDTGAQASARVAAVKELADRGFGKATQYIEQTTTVTYQGLLQQIDENEQKYKAVVEAQEVKEITCKLNWGSLL
ncbi:MAG: hypothetical protein KGL39_19025 [Patescibacteria group bacterium]|nr:hypothetical protein [Patescibacteria group bacterium]